MTKLFMALMFFGGENVRFVFVDTENYATRVGVWAINLTPELLVLSKICFRELLSKTAI